MQSRRDQLAAYRYSVRRVMTALMGSDPERVEQPMRRVAAATMAGVMVAVLALAGVGLYGKLRGGNPSSWHKTDVLIVERETGSRYVWTGTELRPVLNYASARLLLQQPDVSTVKVSRNALAGARRGAPVGIVGAPDSLPDAKHVVSAPWAVCTTHTADADLSTLIIGTRHRGAALGDDAVLVTSGSDLLLVWHGKRLAATTENLRSLGLDAQSAIGVPASWINALPSGPDLVPPTIPDSGASGTSVGGKATRVGDVVKAASPGGDQWYVSLADGLAPITPVQALLLTGTSGATLLQTTTAAVNQATNSQQRLESADLPIDKPRQAPIDSSQQLCVEAVADGGAVPASPEVSIGGDAGVSSPVHPAATTGQTVDQLATEPGNVAVVSALTSDGMTTPGIFLISDAGLRFAVPTADAAAWLGYADVRPTPIPSRLLSLVPQGATLDAESARGTSTP